MNPNVDAALERAWEALDAARHDVAGGYASAAVNRAYYAAFYAASAAMPSKGEAPRTHKGLHDRFRVLFVQTGRVPMEASRLFAAAFDLRQQADYSFGVEVRPDQAEQLIKGVETFVSQVEGALRM